MTICRFYLQGTCRYGNACKFQHQNPTDSYHYGNPTSVLLQGAAKPVQQPQQSTTIDTATLVKSVINDMISAEKGGQWLLSSYAPFKEKGPFPGFEDHSMEEIRYLFYQVMQTGQIEQYKQNLQLMLQEAMMRIKALQTPSAEAVNILTSIYNTSTGQSSSQPNSVFGGGGVLNQPAPNSIFGGSANQQQTQSIFGNQQNLTQNNSIFGGGAAPATNQSIFGGVNANNASTNSIFASQNTNSIFGQSHNFANSNNTTIAPPNQSIFGVQSQLQHQPSPFQPQQPNLFQQNSAVAPAATNFQQQSIFGQSNPPPFAASSQSIFGGAANNVQSPFAASLPSQAVQKDNIFYQMQPQQQQQVQQPPPQGNSVLNKPDAFQHSASIFGNLVGQNVGYGGGSNNFGIVENMKDNVEYYSRIDQLTQEEIEWFQNDDLDIQKIPEKPPAYELCFKC